MSWSVWNKFWRGLALSGLLLACEPSKDIGFGLVPQNEVGVIFTDTLSIETSTILGEVITSNTSTLLVGRYQDPSFGGVRAQTFFQIAADSLFLNQTNSSATLVYDSLRLELSRIYSYGNETLPQTFSLHRITEENGLEREEFNNANSVAFDPASLATFTKTGQELRDAPLTIVRLSDLLGNEIFGMAQTNTPRTEYLQNFKGLALVSEANPGDDVNIVGFSTGFSTRMVLYYSEVSADTTTQRTLSFFIGIGKRFNQIDSERSTSLLGNSLNFPFDGVSISQTDSLAFVQAGVGLQTKISFPTLEQLKQVNNNSLAINRAELVIKAPAGSADFYLPPNLVFYESDASNQILTVGEDENEIELILQQEGRNPFGFTDPLIVTFDARNEEYRADITTYLQLRLTGIKTNPDILISPTGFASSLNRVLINARKSSPFGMKLRLFYTVFK
ncbi:MAG: DUF4270 domain-containing protein [Microscillaceae bacterium]|nr:DUF4270 domain-containing protein [Microscillaceae bacterium]